MTIRPPLEVSANAISVGAESISLPTVRSIETLFDSYFTLVSRLREDDQRLDVRSADVEALATATGLSSDMVRTRLNAALHAVG